MANKQNKKPVQQPVPQNKPDTTLPLQEKQKFSLELKAFPRLTPYLPGLILFFIFVIIGFSVYPDSPTGRSVRFVLPIWKRPLPNSITAINSSLTFLHSSPIYSSFTPTFSKNYCFITLLTFRSPSSPHTSSIYTPAGSCCIAMLLLPFFRLPCCTAAPTMFSSL